MRRKITALISAALLLATVTACGAREVDLAAMKAQRVPGTNDLWWACHSTTLMYISKRNGEDDYEAFFAWGCNPDGTMAGAFNPTGEGQSAEGK